MAINWLDSNSWNVSVWVYFDNNDINKNKIALYSYPYDTDLSTSNLLNDDNGHWAVKFDGFQNVPMGDEPEDISTTCFIEARDWKESIYEALVWALS